MTESGCVECGANTYSSDAASECTSCPDGKISTAGSNECHYGMYRNLHVYQINY